MLMLKHLRFNAADGRTRRRAGETHLSSAFRASAPLDAAVRLLWQCFGPALCLVLTCMMVGPVGKPKKAKCWEAVLAAFLRLEVRYGRWEFYLYAVVAEVRTATTEFTVDTIRICVASQMCANAPAHHKVRHEYLIRVGTGLYRRRGIPVPPRPVPGDPGGFLSREFDMTLVNLCARCERQLQFLPKTLWSMREEAGAIDAARMYVCTTATEDELNILCRLGGLDHTVEALMVSPRFARLFNDDERRSAQRPANPDPRVPSFTTPFAGGPSPSQLDSRASKMLGAMERGADRRGEDSR